MVINTTLPMRKLKKGVISNWPRSGQRSGVNPGPQSPQAAPFASRTEEDKGSRGVLFDPHSVVYI